MLRGEKSLLVVGDEVIFAQTLEDDWVIEHVLPRKNQLERRDSHNASLSHVFFCANVDYPLIVAALQDPIIKTGLIDRYLLIAHLADVPAVIVFNKAILPLPPTTANCTRDWATSVLSPKPIPHKATSMPCATTSKVNPVCLPDKAALVNPA